MIVAEKQRLGRAPAKRLKKSIERLLKALEKELSNLNGDIDTAVRASSLWRANEELLTSVPGVGPTTARTLIAELPELQTLTRKEIAALLVFAPSRASPDSGGERASSKEAERAFGQPCSWRRWSQQGSIPS